MKATWIRLLTVGSFIVPVAGCLWGCTIHTKHNSEIGFRFGTDVAIYHHTTAGPDATGESGIEAPAIVDWVIKPKQAESAEPEPSSGGTATEGADTDG